MISICPAVFSKGSTKDLARRDWHIDNWLELSNILNKNNYLHNFILPKDQDDLFISAKASKIFPRDIKNLFAEIKKSSLVITQDSGYMHIARYYDVKVIALFGPTKPLNFALGKEIIIKGQDCSSIPCHDGIAFTKKSKKCLCMENITVDDVYLNILNNIGQTNV